MSEPPPQAAYNIFYLFIFHKNILTKLTHTHTQPALSPLKMSSSLCEAIAWHSGNTLQEHGQAEPVSGRTAWSLMNKEPLLGPKPLDYKTSQPCPAWIKPLAPENLQLQDTNNDEAASSGLRLLCTSKSTHPWKVGHEQSVSHRKTNTLAQNQWQKLPASA